MSRHPTSRRLLRNMRKRKEIEALIKANVEKVEWTLQDQSWRPTRDYLEKLLAAYKTHTGDLLGILGADIT